MLKVENINVYYGNIHAVQDITFEVAQGEIVSADRRQRRGQEHHPKHHLRPAAHQDRFDHLRG